MNPGASVTARGAIRVEFHLPVARGPGTIALVMTAAQIWFLAGLVLVLAEFAVPGVVLVFIGLGAWVASLTTRLGWTDSLAAQMTMFAGSSLVLLLGLRRVFKSWFMGFAKVNPDTTRDLDEFIGKQVLVVSAFSAGCKGRVEFKGAGWTAESDDTLEPGDTAFITGIDGLCLKVRRKI